VKNAELNISPQPCVVAPDEMLRFCPNGGQVGPSKTIADQFNIPWQQANADIVAGLSRFFPQSKFKDACTELYAQDPAEASNSSSNE
jgi:hypothetical protein